MSVEARPSPHEATAGQAPPAPARPPRLWPAVALVGLYWAVVVVSYSLELTTFMRFITRLGAAVLLTPAFLVWWWVRRRVRFADRLFGFAAVVGTGVVAAQFCHPSVGGVFGLLIGGAPIVLTALVGWMVLARVAPAGCQRLGLLAAVTLAWGFLTLIRTDGLDGEQHMAIHWRWTPTAEELVLAEKSRSADAPRPVAAAAALTLSPGDWPGFRGPGRVSVVRGSGITTDWKTNPPRLVWRQRVGPAWSSVTVIGDRLYTQEQRGEQEAIVCYDAATGRQVWAHEDATRFWETVAGAGPRATPAFAEGRVYALGGTGLLNCLDAATGRRLWSHDLPADAGAKVPQWGFAGSPLVAGGLVFVYAGGEGDKSLLAYRAGTGELAWSAAAGQSSYSSPQPATLAGTPQVLMISDRGLTAVDPGTGAVLWEHVIAIPGAPRSVQPCVVGLTQVLIASEADLGLALLDVSRDAGGWTAAQHWATKNLKPSFNDFVVHDGHVYGFDGAIFACVDLQTGKRRWKDGRYGHGQVVLLADQGLLLVTSETGQAVLLVANPQRHEELGQFQAVNGKTWNHPVLAHGRLYVRNAEEMACYEFGGR
jgi:outer membrane protein assembly factor BamB